MVENNPCLRCIYLSVIIILLGENKLPSDSARIISCYSFVVGRWLEASIETGTPWCQVLHSERQSPLERNSHRVEESKFCYPHFTDEITQLLWQSQELNPDLLNPNPVLNHRPVLYLQFHFLALNDCMTMLCCDPMVSPHNATIQVPKKQKLTALQIDNIQ